MDPPVQGGPPGGRQVGGNGESRRRRAPQRRWPRELLGAGTVFGLPVLSGFMEPIIIFLLPPGGFFVFGMLIALAGKLSKEGKAPESMGCAHCPLAAGCSKLKEKDCKKGEAE